MNQKSRQELFLADQCCVRFRAKYANSDGDPQRTYSALAAISPVRAIASEDAALTLTLVSSETGMKKNVRER